jgi:NTP pyrophosphatase (non-canonical NTP hydrolase)
MDLNFIELSGKDWKVIERNGEVYCYRLYIDDKKHLDIIRDYSNLGDYKYSMYYTCNGTHWKVKQGSDLYECIMEGNNIADAKINDNIADMSIDVEALKKSIEINGYASKSIIAMEELSELSQVVSKAHRYIDGNEVKVNSDRNLNTYDILDNMSEEIADVLICITNLKIMYNIKNEDIKSWIDYKIRRQKIKDTKMKSK